jgi:hypothetical protein
MGFDLIKPHKVGETMIKAKKSIKHLWKCMMSFLIYGLIDANELSLHLEQRCQIRFG